VHEVAGFDAQVVARAGVARLGARPDVDDRAGVPPPGRLQAAAAEFGVDEVGQLPLAGPNVICGVSRPTISSVTATARRMRATSVGDLRPRRRDSSGAALVSREA
jgi:hypothetical protein